MTDPHWPSPERLEALLRPIGRLRVLVCGDLFLDRYLWIDPARVERSLETGREAHQAIGTRCSPGGAGNLAVNAAALGAQVGVMGVIGDDGEGFELTRALQQRQIDTRLLISTPDRPTPSYWKPMRTDATGLDAEMDRIDLRAREPIATDILKSLADCLPAEGHAYDVILCGDQYPEHNCGLFSGPFLDALMKYAADSRHTIWADSRERAAQFIGTIVKPNLTEVCKATGFEADHRYAEAAAMTLSARTHRPVIVTLSEQGALCVDSGSISRVSAVPQPGPIDPTGAGDACLAAMALTHAAGASLCEAAAVGMLAAGFSVRQLGQTGNPTGADLIEIRTSLG